MHRIQITRRGDLSIADHLAQMHAWLDREGIRATGLRPVRVLAARIIFIIEFDRQDEAERFRIAFDEPD
jgi:hypothetical protein